MADKKNLSSIIPVANLELSSSIGDKVRVRVEVQEEIAIKEVCLFVQSG